MSVLNPLGQGLLRNSFRKLRYGSAENGITKPPDVVPVEDTGIYYQAFTHHWNSCQELLCKFDPSSPDQFDNVLCVTNQLEQMVQYLQCELESGQPTPSESILTDSSPTNTSILDLLLSENILGQIISWAKSVSVRYSDQVFQQQIGLYEIVLGCRRGGQPLISHQSVLQPLLAVLESQSSPPPGYSPSPQLQSSLLELVHTLCVLLMDNASLLDLFTASSTSSTTCTTSSSPDTPRFILFSLLTPYLHQPGQLGQQARDSLLLCMALSSKNRSVEQYIANHSNFCPILATGLSGLYSALPRTIGADNQNWHSLDPGDCQDVPGLTAMLTSVELCSAVMEVSPPAVKNQLLDLLHQGFLIPVLGPALTDSVEKEAVISATAYVDLFLRKITDHSLLATFVKFLLTESIDGNSIIDVLIARVNLPSQICLVTLSLFETLISLNLEDVMLRLFFQHLISCDFLLPSHREHLQFMDPHGRAAHKFFNLVPISCYPPSTPAPSPATPRRAPLSLSSQDGPAPNHQHYMTYLQDARQVIKATNKDCSQWTYKYDGLALTDLPAASFDVTIVLPPKEEELLENPIDSGGGQESLLETSGYLSGSWINGGEEEVEVEQGKEAGNDEVVLTPEEEQEFWTTIGYNDGTRQRKASLLARIQHEDRLSMSSMGNESYGSEDLSSKGQRSVPRTTLAPQSSSGESPTLGPLLNNLLQQVTRFSENSLTLNLKLSAVVSRLASYPQPLLKAVLLHPDIVVQPSCTTLLQAIGSARAKIDSQMPGLAGGEEAVRHAREHLSGRISSPPRSESNTSIMSLPASFGDLSLRRSSTRLLPSLGNIFGKRSTPTSPRSPPPTGPSSLPSPHQQPPSSRTRVKQLAMAAVLLEEWMLEMAALAHEHSVLMEVVRVASQAEEVKPTDKEEEEEK